MSLIESIRKPILKEIKVFKELFASTLKTDNPLLAEINEYIVEESGKKIRPLLTLLTASMCGNLNDSSYHTALAMELLHNASLIHEEVMNEKNEPQKNSLQNARWNNKVAVLSGDYMLSNSLISGTKSNNLNILKSIARIGMEISNGELLQLTNKQNADITITEYLKVIQKKTALLFASCAEVGGISAGVDSVKQQHLFRFGESLGLCFQIRDDIIDYNTHFKVEQSKSKNYKDWKITLPLIYALQNSTDEAKNKIVEIIHTNNFTSANIDLIIQFTHTLGGVEYAESKMNELKIQAINELSIFEDSDYKSALIQCVDYATSRLNSEIVLLNS